MYTEAFEHAVNHAMLYEVGGFWKLTPEVEQGLIETRAQRVAVGYVNDPDDAGGETKFGIAKNANPSVDITNLTWAQAKEIYFKNYWLKGRCDQMPPKLAIMHFDGCVNHGVKTAAKFLQRALEIPDDGIIGSITLQKIWSVDELEICHRIANRRRQFYNAIVQNKPSQSKYLKGWLRRINEIEDFVSTI